MTNQEIKKTIKIPWKIYKEAAYQDILRMYPGLVDNPQFMKSGGYEPDREVYDIPEYVEFEIL